MINPGKMMRNAKNAVDLSKLRPQGTTVGRASAQTYVNVAGKNVNKAIASNQGVDNGVIALAKSIDSKFGGYGQMGIDTIKQATGDMPFLEGLAPGAGEFAPIKRTISGDTQTDVKNALDKTISSYTKEQEDFDNYQRAVLGAYDELGAEKFMDSPVVKGWAKGEDFDFTDLHFSGSRKEVASALDKISGSYNDVISGYRGQLENAKAGFMMQEQNAIEKSLTYFTDPTNGKKRAITAGVGGLGLAVGGRLASGGTLTRDSEGRRDIAGVPFI